MKRFSYGERDYAFGQLIVTLRTQLKLTQAELAERLGVSRQAVGNGRLGAVTPKLTTLKTLLTSEARKGVSWQVVGMMERPCSGMCLMVSICKQCDETVSTSDSPSPE